MLSPRIDKPFVVINCAAIPDTLIESELLGHDKGSFTGTGKQAIGKIESAECSTLFLDELGDVPLQARAKLLRFIQERITERIDGRVEIAVNVIIVGATTKYLEQMVAEGTFRKGLYYGIAEMVVNNPPLRDRGEDKLLLSRHFLDQFAAEYNSNIVGFDESAIAAIDSYGRPGNVWELISHVKNSVVMADGKFGTAVDLGLAECAELALNVEQVWEAAEPTAIMKALTISNGKITAPSSAEK